MLNKYDSSPAALRENIGALSGQRAHKQGILLTAMAVTPLSGHFLEHLGRKTQFDLRDGQESLAKSRFCLFIAGP